MGFLLYLRMTAQEKFKTVLEKNTFYFYNATFQEKYESYINALNETLLVLKNHIETQGLKKEIFENLLLEKENGLRALLALTGFANESLKRIITIVRVSQNKELSKLLYKDKWCENESIDSVREWGDSKIEKLIKNNAFFRKGIVNLFFEGATIPFLSQTLPLFELKKLSISKLKFEISALVDTLVRYKEKGSYAGQTENNPEFLIKTLLEEQDIPFEKGDLQELFKNRFNEKRTMDFLLPSKENPQIIIECSFLVTTSSGQGDKSKTEVNIRKMINEFYPEAKFIGFIDGIGWYVRQSDLKRMIEAFDDVFTFHKEEVERFKKYVKSNLKWKQNS
ncbi:hypothetical protein Rain11_0769 [Raineya orbicola]|uniref:BanI/HgiCI C-terminal domain-containing protein n=1 Tax=Raineya orbicola TaxID=2016530 RepID=A0A2N3IJ16_9BACT|nr:hypothetical protein Rain11_0769 [Raineya orbicola]